MAKKVELNNGKVFHISGQDISLIIKKSPQIFKPLLQSNKPKSLSPDTRSTKCMPTQTEEPVAKTDPRSMPIIEEQEHN